MVLERERQEAFSLYFRITNLRSWWENTKKRMIAGELKPVRVEKFNQLLAVAEENKHVNQNK